MTLISLATALTELQAGGSATGISNSRIAHDVRIPPRQLPTDIYDAALEARLASSKPEARAEHLEAQTRLAALALAARSAEGGVAAADRVTGGVTPDPAPATPGSSSVDELIARLPEDVQGEVKRFMSGEVDADFFSPAMTADRIASFALSGFAHFEGGAASQEGTAEARQRFVDYIRPAIDKGFGAALDALGDLDEDVEAGLHETRSLIDEQLDAFASQPAVDETA